MTGAPSLAAEAQPPISPQVKQEKAGPSGPKKKMR
jgi:hypothetical protein